MRWEHYTEEFDARVDDIRSRNRKAMAMGCAVQALLALALAAVILWAIDQYADHCEAHPTAAICTAIYGEVAR